jgi:hypothetical protein
MLRRAWSSEIDRFENLHLRPAWSGMIYVAFVIDAHSRRSGRDVDEDRARAGRVGAGDLGPTTGWSITTTPGRTHYAQHAASLRPAPQPRRSLQAWAAQSGMDASIVVSARARSSRSHEVILSSALLACPPLEDIRSATVTFVQLLCGCTTPPESAVAASAVARNVHRVRCEQVGARMRKGGAAGATPPFLRRVRWSARWGGCGSRSG